MIYKNPEYSPEERTKDLISRMTVEEKFGQLYEEDGFGIYEREGDEITLKKEAGERLARGEIGSLWAFLRADWWTGRNYNTGITPGLSEKAVREAQDCAMSSRLGIPLILAEECAHGLMALGATVFPTGLGQASTFSPELIREMGTVVSDETRAMGARVAFGPVLDLARDPRWSRVEEGYGEDPCLTSNMGCAFVKGLQGDKFDGSRVISTLKHFAAHGEPEGGHNSASSYIGERSLREFHLRAFHAAVKSGALSLMSSYNDIDGVPCTGSRKLLTHILREEWGFKGYVISDAGAVGGLAGSHRIAGSDAECAAAALNAGVDMELSNGKYISGGAEALAKGLISLETLNQAVYNVVLRKFELGLFENPYVVPEDIGLIGSEKHRDTAREVARKALILISNKDKTLPLESPGKIAVIGPNADTPMNQLGDYTAPQKSGSVVTVYEGMKKVFGSSEVNYEKGCKIRSLDEGGFESAFALAEKSDAVVLVIGGSSAPEGDTGFLDNGAARIGEIAADSEYDKDSGEGYDRAYLNISGAQIKLLKKLKKSGKRVITVLIQGRPLKIDEVVENSDAVILAWYPGCEGGAAIAEAIKGDFSPAGRLPISIPYSECQLPVFYNTTSNKSDYIDMKASPSYSFGYGLSYTTFEYASASLNKLKIGEGENAELLVTVKNTGNYDSDEVVQVYIKDCVSSAVRPQRELKAFRRVFIPKGETAEVRFSIGFEELSFYNSEYTLTAEKGKFEIYAGGSIEACLKTELELI